MSVIIEPITIVSSGRLARPTQFSDNFVRANANNWGPNWAPAFLRFNSGTTSHFCSIVGGNTGRYAHNAGGGFTFSGMIPIPLAYLLGQSVNCFAQMTVTAGTNSVSLTGLGCGVGTTNVYDNIGGGCMVINCTTTAANTFNLNLVRNVWSGDFNTAPTQTVLAALAVGSVPPFTVRLEARFLAGTVQYTSFVNGVQTDQRNDATFSLGGPMLMLAEASAVANSIDITPFSCGVL